MPNQYVLMRGDTLSHGRYRILNQITLPEPQQGQGAAWIAIDMQASRIRVVIREVVAPQAMVRVSSVSQAVSAALQRMRALERFEGFPQVINLFSEEGANFMVLLYPEGESLAALLKRQGGALPEPVVAEYGYQLCGLLAVLADQQPPIVHGSINPENIIIREDIQRASLIHVPFFPPELPSVGAQKVTSGYYAPEQVRGEVGLTSDLYGLAATMYHAVTGYNPQERLTFFHPPVRRLNPTVTKQMEMILVRQLSLSISQRYAHPIEMQKDLAGLIESYPDSTDIEPSTSAGDPLLLNVAQYSEQARSVTLLNMGVFAAISVLLLIGVLLVILRP